MSDTKAVSIPLEHVTSILLELDNGQVVEFGAEALDMYGDGVVPQAIADALAL